MNRQRIKEGQIEFLKGIGIPADHVIVIDDFQKEAIESVVSGCDTLVVAPTGAGKTLIATESIDATLHFKAKAIYTTPLKALSNSKYSEFKRKYEPAYSVGLLTGDRKIDTNSDVVIATTEIYRNELYRDSDRYSLVILDEVHYLSDTQRGAVWEESIILTPAESTLLMLSASISNAEEIADWISTVRNKPCKIVTKKERPVELRLGFMHPEFGPIPLFDKTGKISGEVFHFYNGLSLDNSGRRLRAPGEGRPWRNAQSNSRSGGQGRSERSRRRFKDKFNNNSR